MTAQRVRWPGPVPDSRGAQQAGTGADFLDVRAARLHRVLEETRQLVVDHLDRTFAELHNALTYVAASQAPLESKLAEIALQELVQGDGQAQVRPGTVIAVTAEFFGVTAAELRGARGANSLARARQIAVYLCRELTDLSLPLIGREFGRDHTTVMHAIRKIRHEITEVPRTSEQVRDLTELIKRHAVMTALRDTRDRHKPPRRRQAPDA